MRHLHRRDPRCTRQYRCSMEPMLPAAHGGCGERSRSQEVGHGRWQRIDDQCQTFHVIGSHGAHLRTDVARTAHNAAQTSSRVLSVPRRSWPTVGERGSWRSVAALTRAPWTVPTRSGASRDLAWLIQGYRSENTREGWRILMDTAKEME